MEDVKDNAGYQHMGRGASAVSEVKDVGNASNNNRFWAVCSIQIRFESGIRAILPHMILRQHSGCSNKAHIPDSLREDLPVTTQAISIELPEEIFQRLKEAATLAKRPLEDVIFQTIQGNLPPVPDDLTPKHRDLVADLQRLSDDALWAIGKEPLPTAQWQRHQRLLQRSEQDLLTVDEEAELAGLREATDRFVTRRSYAMALLKWRGHTIPAIL